VNWFGCRYRWTFVGPGTHTYTPHLTRIASLLQPTTEQENPDFDLSKTIRIESLAELRPFLIRPEEELELENLEIGLARDVFE